MQLAPAVDGAGHADGKRAALGNPLELEQAFERQR
jgi:hypothetical protein